MAQNLVLFDPADNNWCVVCRIGSIGDIPKCIVAFYKTEDEARAMAKSFGQKIDIPVNIQVFQYSFAKDELDLMGLLLLDTVDFAVKYMAG